MQKSNNPTKKLSLTANQFNTLYSVLLFFISTEATAGVTQFSQDSAKLKEQIDKYGKFIRRENASDNKFLLNYYDREVVQIMKLLIFYNSLRESQTADHFSRLAHNKKSKVYQ